ncbi:MAG: tetratricopeptide repeat protein [Xanthobacteraceae bacterium]
MASPAAPSTSLNSGSNPASLAEAERALAKAFLEHQAGRPDAALVHYQEAIAIHPDYPEALNNLGIALNDLRRFDEAIVEYRKALQFRPDLPEIWNNLGDALHSLGDQVAAIEHYRKALALRPEYGVAWRNLGDALSEIGKLDDANECYARAIASTPELDAALSPTEIGVREAQRLFARMVQGIERAAARDPLLAAAYHACGEGKPPPAGAGEDAVARHRYAEQLRLSYASHLSALLLILHYDPTVAPTMLRDAHGEAQRLYGSLPVFTDFENPPDPERRLRVGYVSADFRTHSVGYFLSGIFREHDDSAVEICCYSGCADEDEMTSLFRSRAAVWRSTIGVSDDDLAAVVRQDGINILVDLSGHTSGNRLPVFARRPAPVQVTWLGYPDTTGLMAIDYRLSDAIVDPPGVADQLSSERLIRLPDGFHCYTAPESAPDVAPLPAAERGTVTFGSFNNLVKVNAAALDLWIAILQRVPGSRLVLKHRWLGMADMRVRMHNMFERRGIARDRVDLVGKLESTLEHLAAYGGVDIALDTFPYNGATTTCESLWMGVPVVTLAGDRHAARVGASMLTYVGLQDLVAESPQAYVETAARLAADLPALASLRTGLRARVAASALCDAAPFTRQLEAAYRTMWRDWCRGGGSAGQV